MVPLTGTRVLATLLLVTLLAAGAVQHSLAHLGIIWRFSVVSWDSPATQWQDVIVSESSAYRDPLAEAAAGLRRPPAAKTTLRVTSDAGRAAPGLASAITRAPPTP